MQGTCMDDPKNAWIMPGKKWHTVEPLLRGHPDERPPPIERPLENVNLNINVLISIPDERPPLFKGHFFDAKGVASQEGFYCSALYFIYRQKMGLYKIFMHGPCLAIFHFNISVPILLTNAWKTPGLCMESAWQEVTLVYYHIYHEGPNF